MIMKDFFKYTLATITGLIVTGIIISLIGAMSIVGMVASSEATQTIEDSSVLVLNLSGVIEEQGQNDIIGRFTGNSTNKLGLDQILAAIRKAKTNDNIKGIYIEAGGVGSGYATLQEIRNALLDFKKSKKWIIAYGDSYSQDAYYIASVADEVYINPKGMIDWHGLATQPMFYKDVMAKFGVRYQIVKVGTYKSFTEAYTENKMTDANREQVSVFLNGLWGNICKAISDSRHISVDSLNAYADRMIMFEQTESLKQAKMVDGLKYADEMKLYIKKKLGLKDDEHVCQVSVSAMQNAKESSTKGDAIAVYYAYGNVVQNRTTSQLAQGHDIVAQDVCKDLEDLANDDDVKAVVIRINSGGGDAYASEQLWHQVTMLKAKKPVVISMGDYAASGAYYMSCNASWIVAQPNTLTGSIGIFAAIPDLSGLITQKLGVHFDEVKTNRNSTFGSIMARPFNAEELGYLQGYVNRGYELFRQRVADGRHQPVAAIEKIAQGRVWLGNDAIKIKLVDQLGSLDDAIAKAASLAKLDKYYTDSYPAGGNWMDQIMSGTSRQSYLDDQLRATLGDLYQPFSLLKNIDRHEVLQARIPFVLNMH